MMNIYSLKFGLFFGIIFFLNIFLYSNLLFSQGVVVDDNNSYTLNTKAMLQVEAGEAAGGYQGLLLPRIASSADLPAADAASKGLLFYVITTNPGYYYCDGAAWNLIGTAEVTLANGDVFIGNASDVATAQTMSGDVTITNAGVTTIQDNSVDGTDIALGSDATGDLMYYNGTDWVRLAASGTADYYLKSSPATAPSWVDPSSAGDWRLAGNTGTTAGTSFLGTADEEDVVFKTNDTERIRINGEADSQEGFVGIGTTAPLSNFHVDGTIRNGTTFAADVSDTVGLRTYMEFAAGKDVTANETLIGADVYVGTGVTGSGNGEYIGIKSRAIGSGATIPGGNGNAWADAYGVYTEAKGGSGSTYGVYAKSTNVFSNNEDGDPIYAYGGYFEAWRSNQALNFDLTNVKSIGVYAKGAQSCAADCGDGDVYGGYFETEEGARSYGVYIENPGISRTDGGTNEAIGLKASVTGGIQNNSRGLDVSLTTTGTNNYGIVSSVTGAGTNNYGIHATASGAGTNYAAYLVGQAFIGDGTAGAQLTCDGTSGDFTISDGSILSTTRATMYINFTTARNLNINNGQFNISNSGDVGIGTTTVNSRLEVAIATAESAASTIEWDAFRLENEREAADVGYGIGIKFHHTSSDAVGFDQNNRWCGIASVSEETFGQSPALVFYTTQSTSPVTPAPTEKMRLSSEGYLGIGRDPTTNDLEVEGSASKTTAAAWLANSDRRIKTNILDIDNSFETIMKLRPVVFKYTQEYIKLHPSIENKYYYNFIAQEYQEVFPKSVKGSGEYLEGDEKEILQIDTYNAQIVTIKAVQELITQNQKQQKLIETLEKRIEDLENK